MPTTPWRALHAIPGQSALPSVWRELLGDRLPTFTNLCLQPVREPDGLIPCPRNCGCYHTIIPRHDRTGAIAICRCDPPDCPDIPLSMEEATPLELNRPRLGRLLCRALGCHSPHDGTSPSNTLQFGSWSAHAVPVFLALHTEYEPFRSVILELAVKLPRPFILFAPTSTLLNADCQELLAHAQAGFFPLDTTVAITESGNLQPLTPPGDLFAQFTPQPKQLDQDAARRAFALIQQLESQNALRPPTTLTVFRLYCIEAMSAAQVAHHCHCSKATILNRLALIRRRTGIDPARFRTLSPHISHLEDQLSDPRARHIRRSSLTQTEESEDTES